MATRSLLTVPLLITVAAAAAAWLVLGPAAALAFVALAFLEIAMAADSSVPMAGIAGRLHSPARRLFLSLGIVAGVLAMRLLLPPAAVAVGDATDPASSVADGFGRLHDTPGVWIGDASAFPSASGTNPMFTVMSLARRTAEAIAAST